MRINKGLDLYTKDRYYLNFKSNLLIEHWEDDKELKEEAIRFFEFVSNWRTILKVYML